jgi:hypothetical protein
VLYQYFEGLCCKNLENLEQFSLMLEVFFSKNKNFHGNLPEAGRLRELDHQQYELERFYHYINIA